MARKLRTGINRRVINKNEAGEEALFAWGWENAELTPGELAEHIKRGVAYTAQLKGKRKAANFLASDIISVDVDRGMTVEGALADPLVAKHASMIYTTVNHRPDAHRFRIVFVTPRTITEAEEMRAAMRSLALRLNGDPSATDAARIFFGNTGAQVWLLGNEMGAALLDELIAQSIHAREGGAGRTIRATRSAMPIDPRQVIRLASGHAMPFSSIAPKTSVYCPFHADVHASAHVVVSQRGVHGLRCSACASTYWPAGGADDFDFFNFDRVARRAREYFDHHRGFESAGILAPTTDTRVGLLGCNITITDGEPAPPWLMPGVTLIKSPKGSGKTESLKRLIADEKKILLVGHRRSLIAQSCKRLDFSCYLNETGTRSTVGVCLDSLKFIRDQHAQIGYDVVILDESEQVLAHFLSDTIDRHGALNEIFELFSSVVRKAKYVVALDADLGWVTLNTLARMMELPDLSQRDLFEAAPPAARLWLNTGKSGQGKTIALYSSKTHLVAELMQTAADGKRAFVTANSKGLVEKLAGALATKQPGARVLVITADTVGGAAQRGFLEDPQREALKYDVILTSPAVGTGVDITFPKQAQLIDVVFGLCVANVNTHFDFDQQLARVRHPGEVRAWIDPRRFHYETSVDVVRRELLEEGLYRHLLIDRKGPGGTARFIDDDPLIEMAALATAQRRASMNALLQNFIAHKREQGYEIEFVDFADDKGLGAEFLDAGKEFGEAQYRARMLAAPPLQHESFSEQSRAIEKSRAVSESAWWSVRRTKVELFYRRLISAELLTLDNRGRYRAAIMLFQRVDRAAAWEAMHGGEPLDHGDKFLRSQYRTASAITKLLQLTPLLRGAAWDTEVVIEGDQLVDFARFAKANKAALENLLGMEIRRDIDEKPMAQLKAVLRKIGLDLARAGTTKRDGRKIYRYRLDAEALRRIRSVLAARERTTAWRFLCELHGWPFDDEDYREDFDDAA